MVTNQLGIRWLVCAKVTKRLLRDQPTPRGWLVCNHLPLTLCPSSMWYGVDGLWRVWYVVWYVVWCVGDAGVVIVGVVVRGPAAVW